MLHTTHELLIAVQGIGRKLSPLVCHAHEVSDQAENGLNIVPFPNMNSHSPLDAVGDLAQLLSGDPLLLLRLGHQHQRGPDPNWLAEGEGGGGSGCNSQEEKS